MNRDVPQLRLARPDETRDALSLLLSSFAPDERSSLAAALATELPCRDGHVQGLVVAVCDESIVGVALAQLHPGRTASVWRPRFARETNGGLGTALLDQCAAWLKGQEARVYQSMLEIDDDAAARWFTAAGFECLARLAFLTWNARAAAPRDETPGLRFEAAHAAPAGVLDELVELSYQETLDCPALNGVRTTADVLEGYRAIGRHHPELWLIAYQGDRPIGCLILAEHPPANQCELVYMGVIAAARGQGIGLQLIAEAQRRTVRLERQQLVLAVDLANTPALTLYHRSGFRVWDQRDVYVSLQDPAGKLNRPGSP